MTRALKTSKQVRPHKWSHYLDWELRTAFCRESVTLTGGANYPDLSVLAILNGKFVHYDSAAADSSATATAVLTVGVDATGGDAEGVVLKRMCTVKRTGLHFEAGQDAAAQDLAIAQLDAANIQITGGL